MHFYVLPLIISLLITSCAQRETGEVKANDNTVPADTISQHQNSDIVTPPFTLNDAESLIGKYFNQENQLAKYAYYKSVATKDIIIDSTTLNDTILVKANSYGRIWNNPNKDTLTTSFSKEIVLKVYRYQQIWWADKLQSPDAINIIPEPVKK
jgi:hypothetical protein